jgi:hypothetical protein
MVDVVVRLSDTTLIDFPKTAPAKTEIYPNPTKDKLTVLFIKDKEPLQIRLSDFSGRILFVKNNLQGLTFYDLQTDLHCGKGIFFLHVVYSDRKDVLKFIKL